MSQMGQSEKSERDEAPSALPPAADEYYEKQMPPFRATSRHSPIPLSGPAAASMCSVEFLSTYAMNYRPCPGLGGHGRTITSG